LELETGLLKTHKNIGQRVKIHKTWPQKEK